MQREQPGREVDLIGALTGGRRGRRLPEAMTTTRATRRFRRSERWSRCRLRTKGRHSPPPARRSGEHRWARPSSTRSTTSSTRFPTRAVARSPSSRSGRSSSPTCSAGVCPTTSTSRRSAPARIGWFPPPTSRSAARDETTVAVASPSLGEHSAIVQDPNALRAVRAALEGRAPPCVGIDAALHAARSRPWSSVASTHLVRGCSRRRHLGRNAMRARLFVFALVMAAVLAVPTPARPATSTWPAAIWSSALDGGPWGLTTDARGAVVVTTDAGRVRALGSTAPRNGRRRSTASQDGLPGDHQRPRARRRYRTCRRPRAPRRRDPMATADGRRRRMRSPWPATYTLAGDTGGTLRGVRRRRRSRSVVGPLRGRAVVGAAGRRCGVGRRSRSGTKNRHPPPAPSISPPVRCAGSTRSGCTPPRPGWITGAPSSRRATGTTTPGLPRSTRRRRVRVGLHDARVVPGGRRARKRRPGSRGGRSARPSHRVRSGGGRACAGRVRSIATCSTHGSCCSPRRVVVTTLSGELFVLDRVSGRVVAHADGQRLRRPSRCWWHRPVDPIGCSSRFGSPSPAGSRCAACRDD